MTITGPSVRSGPTATVRTTRPWLRLRRRERVPRPVVQSVSVAGGARVIATSLGDVRRTETVIGLVDVLAHASCAAVVLTAVQPAGAPSLMTAAIASGYGLSWVTLVVPTEGKRRARRRATLAAAWSRRVALAVVVFVALAVTVALGLVSPIVGRPAAVLMVLSCAVGAPLGALVERRLTAAARPHRVLLVGDPDALARTANRLDRPGRRADVVGTFDSSVEEAADDRLLADRVVERATSLDVDVVILCGAHGHHLAPGQLVWRLEPTSIRLLIDTELVTIPVRRVRGERVGGVLGIAVEPLRPTLGSRASGALQWLIALGGLLVSLPVLALIAVIVRIDSPGPALFVQERVGLHGRRFRMYKFRTMSLGSETTVAAVAPDPDGPDRGPLFKVRRDPRVTRAGRVLRRTSLDELPQLVNVVLGSMRLVGPRPALVGEVARYSVDERRRLRARPGVTGLWQVSGRSDLDWRRSVELDQQYVDDPSLRLDLTVICRTPRAVLGGKGAY